MRTLAHLSDLHFGAADPILVEAVTREIEALDCDLVVVSGDLTQRATRAEYRAAQEFLEGISKPTLVVPGNHDVSLFNPFRRFIRPLSRWRAFIGTGVNPQWSDSEIAVLGLNTARSFTWKNGRISREQMALLREFFCGSEPRLFKIVVTHHPFLPPPERQRGAVVGRAEEAMEAIDACDVDMILSGHYHMSHAAGTHRLYRLVKQSALVVQAGTATSVRRREEQNAFNVIRIDGARVTVEVRRWDGLRFLSKTRVSYERVAGRWEALTESARRELASPQTPATVSSAADADPPR